MKILCELLGVPLLISLLMYISGTQSDRSVNKKHVSSSYSYVMFKYKHANLTQSITFDHEINIFGTKLTQGHGSMKDDMKGNHNGQITKNKNLNQIIALDNGIKDLLRTNLKVSQGHGSIEDDMKMKNNGLILKNKHFNQIIALDNEVNDLLRTNLKENHDSFKPDVNLEDVENIQNRPIQEERSCVVTVGRKTMPVSCESHIFQAPPIPENATVFKFHKIPSDPRLLPEIGNGHLATVLFSDTIYMNGLYNGANTSSHRARIPSRVSFNITGISPANSTRTRVFDMGRGVYYERYEGGGYFIEVRQYAHRLLTRLMVVEVIMRRNGSQHLSINVTVNQGPPSDDINFKNFSFFYIRKLWEHLGRVKPKPLERERERYLQRIATRGVVQLFNAVRKQQKIIGDKLVEAGSSVRKQDKVMESMTKGTFLDLLKGTKSNATSTKVKEEEIKEEPVGTEEGEKWSILRDNFMMGAKMKDWDKEDSGDEGGAEEDMSDNNDMSDSE